MTELTKPGDCNNMDELRHQIDKLDVKIIELLANRSEFIDRATELKKLGEDQVKSKQEELKNLGDEQAKKAVNKTKNILIKI